MYFTLISSALTFACIMQVGGFPGCPETPSVEKWVGPLHVVTTMAFIVRQKVHCSKNCSIKVIAPKIIGSVILTSVQGLA